MKPAVVILFSLLALPVHAQQTKKKPITLDDLAGVRPGGGISPVWAPDGKRFVYRQGAKLMIYDVASKSAREVISWQAVENAAVRVPSAEIFEWENRRVRDQALQWLPDSKDLLAVAGGDVFLIRVEAGGMVQITSTPVAERDVKLSPDGNKIAYNLNSDLYVMDLATKKATRLTHDGSATLLNGKLDWVYPEELDLGSAYWWSPDSKQIAYLQLDVAREMVHPHIDLTKLYARYEPQRYPKAGTPNPDVKLGIVNATGGRTRWLDMGELRERLIARVYWNPDSSGVAAMRLNRVQNEMQLVDARPGAGRAKTLVELKDKAWINVKDDFAWLPSKKQFLMGNEKDGWRHLYLYSMEGREIRQLTRGEWEVTALEHVDEAGGRVYIQSTQESPLERHIYAVSLEGGAPKRLTPERGTHSASFSPNGEYWVDTFSNIDTPAQTVLRDAAGNAAAQLREPNTKQQEEFEILPTELVTFNGSDGTKFYGRLIKPAGFESGKKYPVIVMIYGGPHAQTVRDSWAGLNWDQVLAHRGFLIWQMDNRGSAGRGHLWEAQVNRKLGQLEVKDQLEGINYLKSLGFADTARIGITGWSYGGYMTLQAMLHAPDVFQAGIAGAPVTDWRHYDTIYTERYMGLPAENEMGYKEGSPVHFAANLKGKLMLVHNFDDDNVLYQNNMQMQMALQKAGKQYELLVYPQKSHGVTGPLSRHMREAMTQFFEKNLK